MSLGLLGGLSPAAPDQIIRLMALHRADPRADKVDLGVGMYRTEDGRTPVLAAVREAERRIWEDEETKGYTGLAGTPEFHRALGTLLLGPDAPWERIACLATPGGTGAIRQALDLVRMARPEARVWLPAPTWPNHPAILAAVGLQARSYTYWDADAGRVDGAAMFADLAGMAAGDILMLHGCCHNPTGGDLTPALWAEVADLCARTGAVPLVDMAYQGFGDGLDADAEGLRGLVAALPEVLVGASCSKTFGLYRERVGLVLAVTGSPDVRQKTQAALDRLNRLAFAFPPDHGARVVTTILEDPGLRETWRGELARMRTRINEMRAGLAEALNAAQGDASYDWLAEGRGLFARLVASPAQVARLREDHAVYLVEDGRMNIAGLTPATLPRVAEALAREGL